MRIRKLFRLGGKQEVKKSGDFFEWETEKYKEEKEKEG